RPNGTCRERTAPIWVNVPDRVVEVEAVEIGEARAGELQIRHKPKQRITPIPRQAQRVIEPIPVVREPGRRVELFAVEALEEVAGVGAAELEGLQDLAEGAVLEGEL